MFFDPAALLAPATSATSATRDTDGATKVAGVAGGHAAATAPKSQESQESQTPDAPHRLWLIQHGPGDLRSHSFSPPATLSEIRRWYPNALEIEADPEPERHWLETPTARPLAPPAAAPVPDTEDLSAAARLGCVGCDRLRLRRDPLLSVPYKLCAAVTPPEYIDNLPACPIREAAARRVRCADCQHYRPDSIGDGGLGSCLVDAPASRRPGSLWPGSELRCAMSQEAGL